MFRNYRASDYKKRYAQPTQNKTEKEKKKFTSWYF